MQGPGVQGLFLPAPACWPQGGRVHSQPWTTAESTPGKICWPFGVPSTQAPRGLCFPHLHPGTPEEDRPQSRESALLSSRPPSSSPPPPLRAPRGQACVVKNVAWSLPRGFWEVNSQPLEGLPGRGGPQPRQIMSMCFRMGSLGHMDQFTSGGAAD